MRPEARPARGGPRGVWGKMGRMEPTDAGAPLTVLRRTPGAPAPWRARIDRGADRRITFGGVLLAAVLVALAVVSLALPSERRLGIWLPLHLALAGGAATAIAALLPFFSATLVVAPPAPPQLRTGAITLVAGGAAAVALGHAGGDDRIAAVGGVAYLLGLLSVAIVGFLPLRRAFGPRRLLVERAYAVALADVAVGASLATLFLGGDGAVLAAWASLKPSHAWLNLFGFVTLAIAATLIHLAPTVVGSRIRPRRSARIAVSLLAVGAPIAALGHALGLTPVALGGALAATAGSVALVGHGIVVRREAASWTTDADWHALTSGSLLAGPAWLVVATVIAAARIGSFGATPQGWSFAPIAAPLIAGLTVQVLIGAWSHLVPAIGPGHPAAHARRRAVLGTLGRARLIAWNGSVGVLTVAVLIGLREAIIGAAALLAALAAVALVLLANATVRVGSHGDDPGTRVSRASR